jgi:DNA processing protein
MEKNAPSIAVMGCGLDVRYPQAHANLKTDLVKNGLIFSEFLPGTMPSPGNFPVRNRVLAGLTNGTFVIQAPERSGALITAEDALESGRDVFCIPPADVFDKRYAGVIKYLRDGAVPVFDSRDILYAYYTDYSSYITASVLYGENQEKSESLVMELGKPEKKRNASRSAIRKEADTAAETEPTNLSDSVSEEESHYRDLLQAFEPAEEASEEPAGEAEVLIPSTEDSVHDQILARIRKNGTCHLDEIAADTSLSIEELAMLLTELELMGKIQRMPGKRYQAL